MEPFYPLHAFVCERCFLVQLEEFVPPEDIFTDYAYYSAYSTSWVEHARALRRHDPRAPRARTRTISSWSWRRTTATCFSTSWHGGPDPGIDPAANVAEDAEARGVPTLVAFFGRETARRLADEGKRASLLIGNNVLAQVPDLNDFVAGVKILLRDDGTATFEFPHLLHLLDRLEYDTIYHEHFSYFSFATIVEIFACAWARRLRRRGARTHGGSLRVYAQHADGPHARASGRAELLAREERRGLRSPERYATVRRGREGVEASPTRPLDPTAARGQAGRRLRGAGQGQHAAQLLRDPNRSPRLHGRPQPAPHGLFTPGTHIPIYPPEKIAETRPDYIVVLPWNLIDEISQPARVRPGMGSEARSSRSRTRPSSDSSR